MHCEALKIALATKYILFYAFITEGLQNATIWNTLHKVGNQYQSFTTLGLDSVSSSPSRGKSLVWEEKIVGAATIVADSRV